MTVYVACQNNSGGTFVGAQYVYAVANSVEEATTLMSENTEYDLNADYCECCGERWAEPYRINYIDRHMSIIEHSAKMGYDVPLAQVVLPNGNTVTLDDPDEVKRLIEPYL